MDAFRLARVALNRFKRHPEVGATDARPHGPLVDESTWQEKDAYDFLIVTKENRGYRITVEAVELAS